MFRMNFQTLLQTLPPVDDLASLELVDEHGAVVGTIANQPGQAGSLRVYAALATQFGGIDRAAAQQGLHWFAEHAQSARAHPGSHPNIDRLLQIVQTGQRLSVRLIPNPGQPV